jgi:hypothetical protein
MKKGLILGLLTLLVAMFGVTGCEDTDYPDSVFDPNDPGKPTPVITEVNPATSSYQTVGLVEIYGENFSENISENVVFFNEGIAFPEPAQSDLTADPQKMVVYAPAIIKEPAQWTIDSVKVRIAVQGAYLFGKYADQNGNFVPYTLERPAVEFGLFSEQTLPLAVELDKDDNVYVTSYDGNIYKMMPARHDSMIIYSTGSHNNMTDLKFAPTGELIYARNYKKLFYFPAGGGSRETGVDFGDRVSSIDFDANGIMYAAGMSDMIYALLTDESIVENEYYVDYWVHALKVYNNEIYTLAEYTGSDENVPVYGIYKHDIQGNGVVSDKSLVVNWENTGFDETVPLFMVLNENGNAFVSGDDDGVPLVHVNLSDGSATAVYNYPKAALSTRGIHMSFASDNKLYMVRRSERTDDDAPTPRLIRVSLDVNGAVYHGRQ